jgi:hypothetical protein
VSQDLLRERKPKAERTFMKTLEVITIVTVLLERMMARQELQPSRSKNKDPVVCIGLQQVMLDRGV